MMQISSLGRRPYTTLGRLLVKRMPEVAESLIQTLQAEMITPVETDFSRMDLLLAEFSLLHNIQHLELRGKLHKRSKIKVRKVFIACMLHLYNPQVFVQPTTDITMAWGFTKCLADVLQLKESNVSQWIREIILQEKVYEEFAEAVSSTLTQLTKKEVSDGSAEG